MVFSGQATSEKDADYPERITEICREECSGIILMATEMYREDLRLFSHSKAPLPVLDSLFRLNEFNCVYMNNFEAGYMATRRLIAPSHTAIGHVTVSVRFNNMRYRRQGFEAAMIENHLPVSEDFLRRVKPTVDMMNPAMLRAIQKTEVSVTPVDRQSIRVMHEN